MRFATRTIRHVMAKRDIVVIGASRGGVEALNDLFHELPRDFPAAILVVVHLSPDYPSLLPELLSRTSALKAVFPADAQEIVPGRIYLAPNNHHLLVESGKLRV